MPTPCNYLFGFCEIADSTRLADGANNAAGLGFNGFASEDSSSPNWNGISNVNVKNVSR
jgi:hypothetical protein